MLFFFREDCDDGAQRHWSPLTTYLSYPDVCTRTLAARSMFIQTETKLNADSLKFISGTL
jgi:hypothetical protein